jgi:hypothetical protein
MSPSRANEEAIFEKAVALNIRPKNSGTHRNFFLRFSVIKSLAFSLLLCDEECIEFKINFDERISKMIVEMSFVFFRLHE